MSKRVILKTNSFRDLTTWVKTAHREDAEAEKEAALELHAILKNREEFKENRKTSCKHRSSPSYRPH